MLGSNRRPSGCERLFSKVAACGAVYLRRRFSKSNNFELDKFVFAVRVSLCLFIVVVDVISRLLIWFARHVVVQMRGFFHGCQEFCWRLASWLQFRAFCFACCVFGECCFFQDYICLALV